jgi:predicted Zn finger-like uncharacterized protein
MILTCPSCGTQYVVKDGAIPPAGRQVRCASCKHSWHQDQEIAPESAAAAAVSHAQVTPNMSEPEEAPAPEAQSGGARTDEDESVAEATLIEPRSGPEAEERAYEEAEAESAADTAADEPAEQSGDPSNTYARAQFDIGKKPEPAAASDWREPPEPEAVADDFPPFPAPDEEEPRRRRPALAIIVILLVIVVLAAAVWFLAPLDWKSRLGLAETGASPLALVTTHMDRQRLASGNELLTVTGRVINPTGRSQDVPPLQAQLKTKAGRIVYSWTIAPPARSLAPGASASFNSAEVNVPAGGDELTISLGAAT